MKNRGVKIKICGMREPENLRSVAALQPDFVGLIFYRKSPRFISPDKAAALPQFSEINRVGVFVNENVETMSEIAKAANLFAVQLHGDETVEICSEVKKRNPNLRVIKAFSVDADFDGKRLEKYENDCDYFLFDTKAEKRGGSGKVFDWMVLQSFTIRRPFFLSGGIGAENAREAIAACADLPLFALDLNSRAEISPAVKSPEIISEIIKNL